MSKLKQTRSKFNPVNQIVSLKNVPSRFSTKFFDSKNIIAIYEYFFLLFRFGFVEMVSARGAARAVRGLDGTQLWGKQVFKYNCFMCSGK